MAGRNDEAIVAGSSHLTDALNSLGWWIWYFGWQPGPARVGSNEPVFVSLTDFRIHHPPYAPGAWRTGMGVRRSWPRVPGALGLWLWAKPLSLRSGSVSVWRSEDDLKRFIRSPAHLAIMRKYRPRMSGTSASFTAQRFERETIWTEALERLTAAQEP